MSALSTKLPAFARNKQFSYAAAYYVGFIALGLVGAVMGPTLLGLAAHTGSDASARSASSSPRARWATSSAR